MTRTKSRNAAEQAYLLHDHLEAIITYAHKLKQQRLSLPQAITHEARMDNATSLSDFIETIKSLELVIITKVLRARLWAERVHATDARFDRIVRLFVSGTNTLADSVNNADNPAIANFGQSTQHRDYMVDRGIIPANTSAIDQLAEFAADKHFSVNGNTQLGQMSELCQTFADLLDTHFQLYEPVPATSTKPVAADKTAAAEPTKTDPEPKIDLEEFDAASASDAINDIADPRFAPTAPTTVPADTKLTLSERLEELENS